MTEKREALNTFRHELVKQARWWQWKAETLEKENEQLKSENAALRARLDKAVELPCKVGDTVYWVNEFEIQEGKVVSLSIDKTGTWVYCRYKSGLTYWHTKEDFCKEVTNDRAAVEKRLAELVGRRE